MQKSNIADSSINEAKLCKHIFLTFFAIKRCRLHLYFCEQRIITERLQVVLRLTVHTKASN